MAKYRIVFDRDTCIGVLSCLAVDEKHWEAAEGEPKVDLKGADYDEESERWTLIIDEEGYQAAKDAAEVCPVNAIEVEKIED